MWCLVFPVLGVICLIMFLRARIRKPSGVSLIWKTLTSACFLAFAFCGMRRTADQAAGNGSDGLFAALVVAGLFCGLLGDIWLDLKWNCPEEDRRYTFAGFWSFAAGHGFYLAALLICEWMGNGVGWMLVPLLLAIVLGIAVGAAGPLMHLDYGPFRGITMFYGAMLIGTTLLSGSLLIRSGFSSPRLWLFFVGAVLFLLSDLVLSGTYFGVGKRRPVDIIVNHVLYYAGQFMIAGSILL